MGRIRKTSIALAAMGLVALTLGAGAATAAPLVTKPHIVPPNTTVAGTSSSTVFSAGAIIVTCTTSTAGGKTPKNGIKFTINPKPTFSDGSGPCTDSLGFTDTTVTSGTWSLKFVKPSELEVIVPIGGAVVNNTAGCTITLAPTKAVNITGAYDGVSKFTINATNLPIKITGSPLICPSTTKASFRAVYTFAPGMSEVG
jgi:hypothetical protein